MKNINEAVNQQQSQDPTGVGNVPSSLNVNDELTAAARAGATPRDPFIAELKPKQQSRIIKTLRKNNRARLEGILEDYARTLDRDQLDALLAEKID